MNVEKKEGFIAVGLVLLLVVSAIAYHELSARYQPEDVSAAEASPAESGVEPSEDAAQVSYAADFAMLDADWNEVFLSDSIGTPIVVNFWATWCPPCRSELPVFDAAYQTYGGSIQFLMVDLTDGVRETEDGAKAFVAENEYSFPVYCNIDGSAASAYRLYAVPQTVVIDAEGRIVHTQVGAMNEEMLTSLLETLSA